MWGTNFHGHGGVVGTIVVGFAKYASYYGLIFVDKRHTTKSMKIYTSQKFLRVHYSNSFFCFRRTVDKLKQTLSVYSQPLLCIPSQVSNNL